MSTLISPTSPARGPTRSDGIPPLENGDRLAQPEFHRRYLAVPELKRAELIEGIVYMPSPMKCDHGDAEVALHHWMGEYQLATPGTKASGAASVILDARNEVQPDGSLRILPERGGRTRDANGYIGGPPELVAEVSASSVSRDMNDKFAAYERNGVQEYIVWRVWDAELDWFALRDGRFQRLVPDAGGILKSTVFPGLWLDAPAMLAGNLARVMEVLQQGIAAPEHAAFVEQLRTRGPAGE